MNSILENNSLTIFPEGKIDSKNAKAVEEEFNRIIEVNKFEKLILDAEKILYISSAGLRVILRLKKLYPDFKIVNVLTDVYEIFEMTGFTQIMDIKKAFRQMSVEGCEIMGNGAKGTVYRYSDDTVIKVFKHLDSADDIENEIKLARKAFVLGIPTAIPFDVVKVDGLFGLVFELLNAKSYSQLIKEEPQNFDEYVKKFTDLLKTIHATDVSGENMKSVKVEVNDWLSNAKEFLKEDLYEKVSKKIADVPDTKNMLHCDFHTNNVMMQNGETLLIDMDSVCSGHPIFELANIYAPCVGFGMISRSYVENFFGIPCEKMAEFWNKFLRIYFDGKNIEKIEEKIKIISYLRVISHLKKREKIENRTEIISECARKIEERIDSFDNLYF